MYTPARLALTVAGGAALFAMHRRRGRALTPASTTALAALAFPLVFSVINAAKSDWYIFNWYQYPMITCLLIASTLAFVWVEPILRRSGASLGVGAAAIVLALLGSVGYRSARFFASAGPDWTPEDNGLLPMALRVAADLQDRRGRVAMGDKAGITTFLLRRPVVQLEGLVADQSMLRHIARRDSLNAVLKELEVDYLVTSVAVTRPERRGDCYRVLAPNPDQAGSSPVMSGEFCNPIDRFETPRGPNAWSRTVPIETLVFDLRATPAAR